MGPLLEDLRLISKQSPGHFRAPMSITGALKYIDLGLSPCGGPMLQVLGLPGLCHPKAVTQMAT